MVFGHFNNSIGFLPTPDQIMYGIVLAQIEDFSGESIENSQELIKMQVIMW